MQDKSAAHEIFTYFSSIAIIVTINIVPYYHPLAFSCPSFSCLATWSVIFTSCIVIAAAQTDAYPDSLSA